MAMMWLYYALLSAFLNSFSTLARKTHGSLAHPMELCWWTILFGIPLGFGLLFTSHSPHYSSLGFVLPATLSALIGIASSSLAFYAYQKGETSAVAPLTNLLPVIIVITSMIILGTFPTPGGFLGIIIIVAGVYYSSAAPKKLSHPFRQIFRSKASRAMLGCVLLWSIATTFDKLAMHHASPAFLLAFRQVVSFCVLSLILLLHPQRSRFRRGQKVMQRWGWHILAISVFATLAVYFQLQALKLTDPAYVIAAKRFDVLFTIVLAHFFFKENHIARRLAGSAVAFVGIVIISISM